LAQNSERRYFNCFGGTEELQHTPIRATGENIHKQVLQSETKSDKIPNQTKTFKTEATLNAFRTKAHYLFSDPNLSSWRNTNIRQNRNKPLFFSLRWYSVENSLKFLRSSVSHSIHIPARYITKLQCFSLENSFIWKA